MSSVPMTNDGDYSSIPIIGCNEPSLQPEEVLTSAAGKNSPQPKSSHDNIILASPVISGEQLSKSEQSFGVVSELADSGFPPELKAPAFADAHDETKSTEQAAFPNAPLPSETFPQDVELEDQHSAPFHRIAEVREQQGVSIRSMARRMGIDAKTYRSLEDPARDLTLSELSAIQKALDVPIGDLLVEREGLSQPVEQRAKMVKAMKTAVAIRETKSGPRVQRMAEMLCEQLCEMMPELKDVSGWPQFGARRGANALGKALAQQIDMSAISSDF